MTDKMDCAMRHIRTAVDVDPWAKDEVERVFRNTDKMLSLINGEAGYYDEAVNADIAMGLYMAAEIITEIMEGKK